MKFIKDLGLRTILNQEVSMIGEYGLDGLAFSSYLW